MKIHRRLIFGIAYFALLLLYIAAGIYVWAFPPGSFAGWYLSRSNGEFYVGRIDQQGPAHGLRAGDKIIAVNGINIAEQPRAVDDEYRLPPGSRYSMTVEHDGQRQTLEWQTVPRERQGIPLNKPILILFWVTGFLVLLKSQDQQAWLLALTLGSLASLLGGSFQEEIHGWWLELLIATARICGLLSFPLLLHLFLYFPQPSMFLRRWPGLTRWLYVPTYLFVLPYFGVGRLPLQWASPISKWGPTRWLEDHGLGLAAFLSLLGYLVAALVCLWMNYRAADTAGRRRLRVVMWGSLIGFGSLFLVVLMELTNTQKSLKTAWDILQAATLVTLPLVPLSFAYAIVRHRVIPISLIFRRGMRYLLVSRGSVVVVLLFTGLIVAGLQALLFRYLRPSGVSVGLISAAEAIAAWQLARWLHRRYLAPVIDRRFFRQTYDAQQIVSNLSQSLRSTTDAVRLLETIGDNLQAALQTESVRIFLRDRATDDYFCAYSCVHDESKGYAIKRDCAHSLSHDAATLAHLGRTGEPLELDGSNPAFDLGELSTVAATNGHSTLTSDEKKTLTELNVSLLLPLKATDGMPGVIALGSRLGDVPFSREDKRLLQSVGDSASLALENARLVQRVLDEAHRRQEIEAQNDQRAKELEEARQLQLSMLPRLIPQLPHVEIAAYMKTATEVGGDYYDFHVGSNGELTIAIGDATGHGLKAGTIVSATKSLFNHLASQSDLAATLEQTSSALKLMNLKSLFMALTLIKVNGNQVQCSVAGMPPILVYRAATRMIEEVPLHGVPLGALSHYDYRQSELTLAPGDAVLLLSDGLPERFNGTGEMFGYDRIKELMRVHASKSPQMLLEELLRTGDEWACGKVADDDITFVALRRHDS